MPNDLGLGAEYSFTMHRPVTPDADIRFSIVVINRNGMPYLATMLQTLCAAVNDAVEQHLITPNSLEVVFVDNASQDESLTTIETSVTTYPCPTLIIRCQRIGVSSARNAGVRAATGEWLIFLDSDVRVQRNWLVGYLVAISQYDTYSIFGGRVLPYVINGRFPDWLDLAGKYRRQSLVGMCDNGERLVVSSLDDVAIQGPIGANFAVRRDLITAVGGFDENLGIMGDRLTPGSEEEFFIRVRHKAPHYVYVPGACVYHPIKPHQMRRGYFYRRMYGMGLTDAALAWRNDRQCVRIFGVRRYLSRSIMLELVRLCWACVCGDRQAFFFHMCSISFTIGQVMGDVKMVRQRKED